MAFLLDPRFIHVLSYGTYLGSTFFQSFVAGITAYRTLPRPQFSRLQQVVTPTFFALQTAMGALMLLTYPGSRLPGLSTRISPGLMGVFAKSNRWTVGLPLTTIALTSLVNLAGLGPATTAAMKERHHQETRDGKKSYDAGPHSTEMQRLNKKFGSLHGASTLFNLAGFGSAIYYASIIARAL